MNKLIRLTSLVLVLTFLFGVLACAPFTVSAAVSNLAAVSSIEQLGDISICGNGGTESESAGTDNWLNGSYWDPAEKSNVMTEIRENIYSISFGSLPALSNYQFKFLSNYNWEDCNWGEAGYDMGDPTNFHGAGVESDARFFGANILFGIENDNSTAEIKFDITNFDLSVLNQSNKDVSCGTKYTVYIYNEDGTPINGYDGEKYGDYLYVLSGDNAVITKYDGSESEVVVPDTIDGHKVVEIGGGAFANNDTVSTVTVPASVSYIGAHAFTNCTALKTVKLSETTVRIASKAFSGCSNLTSLNLSDTVTSLEDDTFIDCPKLNIVCYPASYVHTYALENNISFSFDESHNGKVNVKAEGLNGCTVKLTGYDGSVSRTVKDGKALFSGLRIADTYSAELSTKSGRLLDKIEKIKLIDGAYEVVFDQINFYNSSVNVIDEKGNTVSDCQYKWFVNDSAEVESAAQQVNNLCDGDKVKCVVSISDALMQTYEQPEAVTKTINGKNEEITIQLFKPETISTKVIVKDENDFPVTAANISFVQEINQKVNRVISLTTDENGEVTVDLRKQSTTAKASKSGYFDISKSFTPSGDEVVLKMSSAVGATFVPSLNTTYIEGVLHSSNSVDGITYSIKNLTTGKKIDKFNNDNGIITIPHDSIAQGDQIEFTAIDTLGCFATAKKTVKYENATVKFDLDLTEKGLITFDYSSQNDKNVALVFTSDGEYIMTVDLSNNNQSQNLDVGSYRVVMMGYSDLLYKVKSYNDLLSYGLKPGESFIEKTVSVSNGAVSKIKDVAIPQFSDNSIFMIDKSSSCVTYTPANGAPGNYVTATVRYSFLEKFQDSVEVNVVNIQLPDGVKLMDGVRSNNHTVTDYSVNDSVLTVPVEDKSGFIRFCLLPEAFVSDVVSASVSLNYNGKALTQPIGSTEFTLRENLSVPKLVANADFPVSGTVNKKATVDIYVDGELQKSVKANQLGYFTTGIHLENTFSHTYHRVYFEITSNSGNIKYKSSDYSVEFEVNSVTVKKITMSPNGHMDTAVLYDADGEYSPNYFYEPNLSEKLTFTVEFTGDMNQLNGVILVSYSTTGAKKLLDMTRIGDTAVFSCSSSFSNNDLPVRLGIKMLRKTDNEYIYDDVYSQSSEERYQENRNDAVSAIHTIDELIDLLPEEERNLLYNKRKDSNADEEADKQIDSIDKRFGISSTADGGFEIRDNSTNEAIQYKEWYDSKISEQDLISQGYVKKNTYSGELIYERYTEDEIVTVYVKSGKFVSQKCTSPDALKNLNLAPTGSDNIKEVTRYEVTFNLLDILREYAKDLIKDIVDVVDIVTHPSDYLLGLLEAVKDFEDWISNATPEEIFNAAKGYTYEYIKDNFDYSEEYIEYSNSSSLIEDLENKLDCLLEIRRQTGCPSSHIGVIMAIIEEMKKCRHYYRLEVTGYTIVKAIDVRSMVRDLLDSFKKLKSGKSTETQTGDNEDDDGSIDIEYEQVLEYWKRANDFSGKLLSYYEQGCRNFDAALEELRKNCHKDPPEPDPDFDTPIDPTIDPAGYVCEAVGSNRLKGVKTTLYYSENADGSNAELWDAEDFSQQNPLITDSQGQYQWYVPEGYWQVKYEKDGYETAYSEWLPVPPPQLDVNVAMISMESPSVENIKAYSDSIDITFSQYMNLDTVNTDTVTVTMGEQKIEGEIIPVNAEASFADENISYASKFTFKPTENTVLSDSVTVSVSGVRNYAGSGIDKDFTDNYQVEYRVSSIDVAKDVTVNYGEPQTISLSVKPDEAAAGKKILIQTQNSSILSIDKESVITDDNGNAQIEVSALLPGTAKINYQVEGTDIVATTVVTCTNNRPSEPETLDRVTASISSGTAVKKGTTITLSSSNPDAKIYYTLDLSCPCQLNNPARTLYTEPIVIKENMNIIAYAVLDGYKDSNTILFTYTLLPDVLLGDVDGDGKVTISDVTIIQRKLAKISIPFEFSDNIADTDGDKKVTISDATYIQRWLASLPSNNNIGKPIN